MKRILMILGAMTFFLLANNLECDARIRDEQIALGGIYPGCPFSEVVRMYGEPDESERHEIPYARCEGTKYRYGNAATLFVTDEGIVYYIGVSKDSDFSTPDGVRLGTDLDTLKSIYGKEDYYNGHTATLYMYYGDSDETVLTFSMDRHHNVKSISVHFKG